VANERAEPGRGAGTSERAVSRRPWQRPWVAVSVAFLAAAVVVVVALAIGPAHSSGGPQATALATNPDLDPGTPLSGPAPAFTLTSQFGRPVTLRSYRGHVVLLAFNDAECTTVCPLTTAAMVEAKSLLGPAASGVELLGINANPQATAVKWVREYSQVHGMLHQWQFLTGSPRQLRPVWKAYNIEAQIDAGQIDHTPALYVIDTRGRLAKIYLTQMAYRSVPQQAQILAKELSSLLPGRPRVHSSLSYQDIPSVRTTSSVSVPRAGGGSVRLGPDGAPRLYVFFASWLTETIDLRRDLDELRGYQRLAADGGLPRLTAVDEGSVEPTAQALPRLLGSLSQPLSYPVAIDPSGRVADGYLVQDQPWFVLVSRSGRILWYSDASTQGWPSVMSLVHHVGAALSTPPSIKAPPARALSRLLANSPPPLAAIHTQAGRLLGSASAVAARVRALRGYPIVINAWASWCGPCQAEAPLFGYASVHYGRQIAFLGVDALDYGASYARGFLAKHPLSYPSYESPGGELPGFRGIFGLPTTIFIDRAGKVVYTTTGQYDSQGALDGDIQTYALGE
jgi:cytochrome oxidase Cu insertion factor (SCO1/SenC/PrrC family)/thiol-disulfide isomerase/thioredoxin